MSVIEAQRAAPMDPISAVNIVENPEQADEQAWGAAWQYLHDSGLAYQLQGWYGRTAQDLIARDIIDA